MTPDTDPKCHHSFGLIQGVMRCGRCGIPVEEAVSQDVENLKKETLSSRIEQWESTWVRQDNEPRQRNSMGPVLASDIIAAYRERGKALEEAKAAIQGLYAFTPDAFSYAPADTWLNRYGKP